MIEATQKKLRETQFFYRHLVRERDNVVRNEPEAFLFILSAFLSAGRSVTFALQKEKQETYKAWRNQWLSKRADEERQLLTFMNDQRVAEVHKEGARTTAIMEYIPITEIRTENRSHPAFGVHWFGPPGTPSPGVGRPTHSFELGGSEAEVTATCKQYLNLLEQLVQEFIQSHS